MSHRRTIEQLYDIEPDRRDIAMDAADYYEDDES